jgi:hypothetical protein
LYNIFRLTKKEKQDLENYKVDFLNLELEDDIEMTIDYAEESGKSLYSSFSFNNKYTEDQLNLFILKLNEICILKN